MKKIYKIFLLFAFCFIIFGFTKTVQANSIEKISMDVYIDNNGDASVTEVWNCQAYNGTEVYHPYYNLGKSKIVDLTVSDSGVNYQTLNSWSTSGSLQSKAQKCGINKVSNGVEICWGISEYGYHSYTVKYTITNFVAELTDSQMVYWTLIPQSFSNNINNIYIKIHAADAFPDTTPVWGYGNYGGTAYVYNGYIEMQPNNGLSTDEYMTILVQFPKGTFNTNNTLNHDFNYYYKMANEGSVKYNGSKSGIGNIFIDFMYALVFIFGLFVFIFVTIIKPVSFSGYNTRKYKGEKLRKKEITYYRDLPENMDLLTAYYIGYNYGLIKRESDLLGALLLKWIKSSDVKLESRITSNFITKKETVIIFNASDEKKFNNSLETLIYDMLYNASKDGILEKNEFKKWCNKHYSMILSWFKQVLTSQCDFLVEEGLIVKKVPEKSTFFSQTSYSFTPELKQKALQLAGLKKYLKDYTLIADREPIEVTLFEEYLIYAQLFGIAKKVAKNFNTLYPEMIEKSVYSSYNDVFFVNTWSYNTISYASSAKSRAESYSSGGGGYSSGGGGGGSFGGGGSGGGFR